MGDNAPTPRNPMEDTSIYVTQQQHSEDLLKMNDKIDKVSQNVVEVGGKVDTVIEIVQRVETSVIEDRKIVGKRLGKLETETNAQAVAIAVLKVKSGFIAAISGFFAGVGGALVAIVSVIKFWGE